MRTRGLSFRHAVEILREAPVAKRLPPPIEAQAEDRDVLKQVVDYYHDALKESPEALRYLESRGLTHPEMISHFKIGFANRTLGYRLPEKNRKAGAQMRGRLQALGILRESGHEHFNGSIVIPISSCEGDVLGMYGRKITPNLREGTPLHLYLPGPHRGVFNEQAVRVSKEISAANFFAESAVVAANRLESMARRADLVEAPSAYSELEIIIGQLMLELTALAESEDFAANLRGGVRPALSEARPIPHPSPHSASRSTLAT